MPLLRPSKWLKVAKIATFLRPTTVINFYNFRCLYSFFFFTPIFSWNFLYTRYTTYLKKNLRTNSETVTCKLFLYCNIIILRLSSSELFIDWYVVIPLNSFLLNHSSSNFINENWYEVRNVDSYSICIEVDGISS